MTFQDDEVSELLLEEQTSLGVMMAATASAMKTGLQAERVYFGLYAEAVRHIHLHVTPRTRGLPAGNIPLTLLSVSRELLMRLRMHQPIAEDQVLWAASQIRKAFAEQSPNALSK